MRFRVMGVVILIISLTVIHFANWPSTLPERSIVVMSMNGPITPDLDSRFQSASHLGYTPDYLIVAMNSTGGDYYSVLAMGASLRAWEHHGVYVIFLAGGNYSKSVCTSGCFLLSGFANSAYVKDGTRWGFNHPYSDIIPIYRELSVLEFVNRGVSNFTFWNYMNQTQTVMPGSSDGMSTLNDLIAILASGHRGNITFIDLTPVSAQGKPSA